MKKALKIIGVAMGILVGVGVLFVLGTTVYANTTIDGFTEILQAALNGWKAYLDWLVEIFSMIL